MSAGDFDFPDGSGSPSRRRPGDPGGQLSHGDDTDRGNAMKIGLMVKTANDRATNSARPYQVIREVAQRAEADG